MLTLSLARRVFLSLLCLSLPVAVWAGDINQQIEEYGKKVDAEILKNPQIPGNVHTRRMLQEIRRSLRQGNYDNALQILTQASYDLSPDQQADWQRFANELTASIEKEQANREESIQKDANALIADTRKACLEAKSSADLDSLFIRCAAMQGERNAQSNALNQRVADKITGCATTLDAWAKYLDLRDAGDARRANDTLKRLANNNSGFPVLKIDEIDARYMPVPSEEMNPSLVFFTLAAGVKTPEELPALKQKTLDYMAIPKNQPATEFLEMEIKRIDGLLKVQDLIAKKDYPNAFKAILRWNSSGRSETMNFYDPIREQLQEVTFAKVMSQWTKLQKAEDEIDMAFIDRVLAELSAKGEYAQVLEVLNVSEMLQRMRPDNYSGTGNPSGEKAAIEKFLAAQRFEEAGDYLSAITNYRLVVAAKGPNVPTDKAKDALKILIEKYPELAKNQDGFLLQEMQSLRQEIRMIMGRLAPGRPFPN